VHVLLALLLVAAPPEPEEVIHARAWKVAVAGGVAIVVGGGFFLSGRLLEPTATGPALNTARAFEVGGVLLMCTGGLIGLLSIPLFTWHDERVAWSLSIAPAGLSVSW
jgi:hypothetical protein